MVFAHQLNINLVFNKSSRMKRNEITEFLIFKNLLLMFNVLSFLFRSIFEFVQGIRTSCISMCVQARKSARALQPSAPQFRSNDLADIKWKMHIGIKTSRHKIHTRCYVLNSKQMLLFIIGIYNSHLSTFFMPFSKWNRLFYLLRVLAKHISPDTSWHLNVRNHRHT